MNEPKGEHELAQEIDFKSLPAGLVSAPPKKEAQCQPLRICAIATGKRSTSLLNFKF